MTRSQHYKELLKLGLPIIVGQLGMIVLSFADTMMVGRCGTAELGAASFVNNMFNLAIVFATGFSYGLTPVAGKLFGADDSAGVGRTLKNAMLVNGLTALGLVGLMAVLYFNIHHLGQPLELLPLIRPYYLTLLASLLPVLLFNAFKQFSDGITDTMTPMFVLIGGNVFNIVGNWLLIYGKCGFPELGLMGAGVATLSSRILMLLVFAFVFLTARRYGPYRKGWKSGKINKADFKTLFAMGMPVGMQMGMETASFSLSTIMVGWLGTVALAAHQVMITVGQLGFMVYYGMAAAVAVKTSNYYGAADYPRVRMSVSSGFRLILIIAACLSVFLLLVRNHIGMLFSENPEVIALTAQLIIPFVIYQFGDGMQCNYSNALRGISDVKMVSWYAFVAYFIVSLPAAYVFGFVCGWGLLGIWLSFPLGLTTAGVLFWLRYRSTMGQISAR